MPVCVAVCLSVLVAICMSLCVVQLALRAGNEKDEDQADTVGCCSIRTEHIKLHEQYEDGKQFVVEFDFLGKDSIRYYNRVEVEKRVFKNLQLFMENKQDGDDLFDRLNVTIYSNCFVLTDALSFTADHKPCPASDAVHVSFSRSLLLWLATLRLYQL